MDDVAVGKAAAARGGGVSGAGVVPGALLGRRCLMEVPRVWSFGGDKARGEAGRQAGGMPELKVTRRTPDSGWAVAGRAEQPSNCLCCVGC